MEPLETLAAGIKHVDSLLDEDVLEPDLDRNDWARMKARVGMVREGLDKEVTGVLEAAHHRRRGRGDAGDRAASRRVAAGAAGALLHASGDEMAAMKLRANALRLAPAGEDQDELRAGDAEPLPWVRLQHARWLLFHQRRDAAERAAKDVIRKTTQPVLRAAAKKIVNAPRPLTSAPTLFRLNGCGVGLYGSRDRTPDGWYVATYCISILFIPVFPLTAYRVRHAGGNSYSFLARESLGPIARAWQIVVTAAAMLGIGWIALTSYLDAPEHKAKVAVEEARKAEASGDRRGALEKYAAALRAYEGTSGVAPAAEAVIRLSAANVPDPCTVDAIDKVRSVVDEWSQMPSASRASAAGPLAKQLETWADQIGEGSVESVNAGLQVLDMAATVADGRPELGDVEARRGKLRRALAGKVVGARPLQALALYVQPPADPGSLAAAGKILDGFGPAPSLWLEAEPDVLAWASEAGKHPDTNEAASQVRARLRAAHEARDAAQPLIDAGDEKKLAAALAQARRATRRSRARSRRSSDAAAT